MSTKSQTPLTDARELELVELTKGDRAPDWEIRLMQELLNLSRDIECRLNETREIAKKYEDRYFAEKSARESDIKELAASQAREDQYVFALQQIANWNLPESTFKDWTEVNRGTAKEPTVVPCSYETAHGSNGARDYIRKLAGDALIGANQSPVQRKYPCGCVSCICADEQQCHGCGAKSCDANCTWRKQEAVIPLAEVKALLNGLGAALRQWENYADKEDDENQSLRSAEHAEGQLFRRILADRDAFNSKHPEL